MWRYPATRSLPARVLSLRLRSGASFPSRRADKTTGLRNFGRRYQGKLISCLLVTFDYDMSQGPAVKEKRSDQPAEHVDKRVHVALPIRITYWDKDKKPD